MTTAEQIYNTVKELPEPALREVLDFAEFLKKKKQARSIICQKNKRDGQLFCQPQGHRSH